MFQRKSLSTILVLAFTLTISGCSTPQPSLEVRNICSYIETYLEKSKKDYRDADTTDFTYTFLAQYIVSSGKQLSSNDFGDLKRKVRKFAKLFKGIKVGVQTGTDNLEVAEGLALQPQLIAIQNEFCSTP